MPNLKHESLLEMNVAAFLIAPKRCIHGIAIQADPSASAWPFFEVNGETSEARGLRNVIRTLATSGGKFSQSEVGLSARKRLRLLAHWVKRGMR